MWIDNHYNPMNNVIADKSYAFALRIVKLYKHIVSTHKERAMSIQVLRSGTSVGANVEEAIGGYSRKEFASKMSIAYKEARETKYWIRLLRDSDYIESVPAQSLLDDCEELLKLLGSIIRTTRKPK